MQCVKLELAWAETLDVLVIQLVGEFDFSERERLVDAFAIARSASLVVVNLEKTTYIDSSALQCLAEAQAATNRRGAALILTGVAGAVQRLLEVSGLAQFFDVRRALSDIPIDGARIQSLTMESRPLARAANDTQTRQGVSSRR